VEGAIKRIPIVRSQALAGFTIWGLLALLAGIFLIIIVLLPAPIGNHGKAPRTACTAHLKQISLAMLLWSEEHGTNFPMHVPSASRGSKELTALGWVSPTFWTISNDLRNLQVITCPSDKERLPPVNSFNSMTDSKISYFLHPDATADRPDAVLLGDRNVATNGVGLPTGVAQIHDVQTVSWTTAIHKGQGNVALADGSVQQVTSKGFRDLLKATTNTLVIP
jgi:prepilin-type processing-associated H-X9-DG protein